MESAFCAWIQFAAGVWVIEGQGEGTIVENQESADNNNIISKRNIMCNVTCSYRVHYFHPRTPWISKGEKYVLVQCQLFMCWNILLSNTIILFTFHSFSRVFKFLFVAHQYYTLNYFIIGWKHFKKRSTVSRLFIIWSCVSLLRWKTSCVVCVQQIATTTCTTTTKCTT